MFSPFYRAVFLRLIWLVSAIGLLRVSGGAVAPLIILFGVWSIFNGRMQIALSCYCIFPFLTVINPVILPMTPIFALTSRLGLVLLTLCLMVKGSGRGRERIPVLSISLYLICAVMSSVTGYMPAISLIKIVNFFFFILGLYYISVSMDAEGLAIVGLREFCFAFALFVVGGSILTLPFPHIAYYVTVSDVLKEEGVDAAQTLLETRFSGTGLFCGVMNQSQALAPILSCLWGWVVCDFIMIARGRGWLHLALLGIAPILMFMTRSRSALFSLLVAGFMALVYLIAKIRLSPRVKRRIRTMTYLGAACLFLGAAVVEVRSNAISRWVRKTDNVEGDQRGLGEALTASRQGRIEECLRDFRKNPFLGMGFQVNEFTPIRYQMGQASLLSAPIEKGFVPAMILGEGGVLGAVVFSVFLAVFYSQCIRRRYYACLTMFTVMLSTNFAEATIFSPGGMGGAIWIVCVIGGFIVDLFSKRMVGVGNQNPRMIA